MDSQHLPTLRERILLTALTDALAIVRQLCPDDEVVANHEVADWIEIVQETIDSSTAISPIDPLDQLFGFKLLSAPYRSQVQAHSETATGMLVQYATTIEQAPLSKVTLQLGHAKLEMNTTRIPHLFATICQSIDAFCELQTLGVDGRFDGLEDSDYN